MKFNCVADPESLTKTEDTVNLHYMCAQNRNVLFERNFGRNGIN